MAEDTTNQQGGSGTKKHPTTPWKKFRRKLSKTALRVPHIWLRHRGIHPADCFFASYPRSGTTWSRFTLFELLSGQDAGFDAVNAGIRGVGRHSLAAPLLPQAGRMIATHEQYRADYHRAIYLVRDARDVALSEFAYTRALEFFDGDLDEFIQVFLYGKISGFGPWPRHIDSWLNSPIAGTDRMLLVKFEELRENPEIGFKRMADFLGVNVDADRVRRAVANNALDRMKEKEQKKPQRASVKDRFVRSGSVQGWRGKLNAAQLQMFDRYAGAQLKQLGYPLSSEVQAADLNPVSVG